MVGTMGTIRGWIEAIWHVNSVHIGVLGGGRLSKNRDRHGPNGGAEPLDSCCSLTDDEDVTPAKYRVTFTEILSGGRKVAQDAIVYGDLAAVQERLDRTSWIVESVTVTEYVGSDAAGRTVELDEWFQG